MIELIDGYAIKVSKNCYIIGKHSVCTNKNSGEQTEYFKEIGYYPTIEGAIRSARKHLQKEALLKFKGSLAEAIKTISEIEERFNMLLDSIPL